MILYHSMFCAWVRCTSKSPCMLSYDTTRVSHELTSMLIIQKTFCFLNHLFGSVNGANVVILSFGRCRKSTRISDGTSEVQCWSKFHLLDQPFPFFPLRPFYWLLSGAPRDVDENFTCFYFYPFLFRCHILVLTCGLVKNFVACGFGCVAKLNWNSETRVWVNTCYQGLLLFVHTVVNNVFVGFRQLDASSWFPFSNCLIKYQRKSLLGIQKVQPLLYSGSCHDLMHQCSLLSSCVQTTQAADCWIKNSRNFVAFLLYVQASVTLMSTAFIWLGTQQQNTGSCS